MGLPKQIQEQVAEVESIYEELGVGKKNRKEKRQESKVAAEQTPAESVESVKSVESDEAIESVETTEPVDVGDESTEVAALEAAAEDDGTVDWEQKYKTLQGMYNKDVPQLNTHNRELTTRVSDLESVIAQLAEQPSQRQAAPMPQPLITDRDREEYGDSIDVMRRAAREEVATSAQQIANLEAQLAELRSNVVPRVNQLAQTSAQTAETTFWNNLTRLVPSWQTINNDAGFQAWLLESDPLTGISRQTYLEDAQSQLDADRVSRFFTAWADRNKGATGEAMPKARGQDPRLAAQIAPGPSRYRAPATSESEAVSRDAIGKFYTDVSLGKYENREAERNRIERDIFAAAKDGRIQQQ